MVQIVATDELARQLEKAEGVIELVDSKGNRLGTLTRPPTADDRRPKTFVSRMLGVLQTEPE